MKKLANFINGNYATPKNGEYLDKISPSTGEVVYQLPDSSEVDVVLAIQAAHKAYENWSKMLADERADILNKIADVIDRRAEELALAETLDVGKPLWLSKDLDIPRAAKNFRFFASKILHKEEMATDMDGKGINYVLRQPVGVAGLIAPWNLPLYLLTWKIAPAIAVGNTVVCKPSELTPMTAYLLGEILKEAGLPDGVVNIVFGRGEVAGATLVQHPGVPLISFTGGSDTGAKIQAMAAPQFKKLSLELGGKNAAIVFDDADLNRAVPGVVRSSFLNQGEICLCGERIFVQEKIFDQFMAEFKKQTEELVVGDPADPDSFMGPLISEDHYNKVMGCINKALSEKGKIVTGGERPELPAPLDKGYFLKPTIISDLDDCSELQQTEIFGPVVTVRPFKYQHEAIKWANTTPYGLSASVWSKDLTKAHKTAAGLNVGTVWVNTWLTRDLRVPFGGAKASGLGREGGDHSIDFFTETKTVCVQF